MTSDIFRKEIERLMDEAKENGCKYVDIISGDVHRNVGGYPGRKHNMPSCCTVMYSMMKSQDKILYSPPKGKGATLEIRYII